MMRNPEVQWNLQLNLCHNALPCSSLQPCKLASLQAAMKQATRLQQIFEHLSHNALEVYEQCASKLVGWLAADELITWLVGWLLV